MPYPAFGRDELSCVDRDTVAPTIIASMVANPVPGSWQSPALGGSRRGSTVTNQDRPTFHPETKQSHRTFPSRRGRRGSLGGFTHSVRSGRNILFTSVEVWLLVAALAFLLAIVFGVIDAQQVHPSIRIAPLR
jgi:hypothetical protein